MATKSNPHPAPVAPEPPADTAPDPIARLRAWYPHLSDRHLPLLLEACARFGIDPDPDAQPRELTAAKGYGDPRVFDPDRVVIVTAGGQKLCWPLDEATTEKLKKIFGCYVVKTGPNRAEYVEERPLPADLTLAPQLRTGIVPTRATDRPAWWK